MREILNAIAAVEPIGKRASFGTGGRKVTVADLPPGLALINEGGARRLRLVKAEATAPIVARA